MKMIQEHFCNYENSLALRELGFDEATICAWNILGKNLISKLSSQTGKNVTAPWDKYDHALRAPLLSQAIQWIRDEKHIIISITSQIEESDKWLWGIYRFQGKKYQDYKTDYSSWNQCAQDAITKAIEIIKNEIQQ